MKKNQKEIEKEIEWYNPKPSIARGMRKLGEWGFAFGGHGVGFGCEDFSLWKGEEYSVEFCDFGPKTRVDVTVRQHNADDDDDKQLSRGTVAEALRFLENIFGE